MKASLIYSSLIMTLGSWQHPTLANEVVILRLKPQSITRHPERANPERMELPQKLARSRSSSDHFNILIAQSQNDQRHADTGFRDVIPEPDPVITGPRSLGELSAKNGSGGGLKIIKLPAAPAPKHSPRRIPRN